MTVITHVQRRSRLSELIDQPGGLSVGVALAQAEANLAAFADEARKRIRANLAVLESAEAASPQDRPTPDRAYRLCAEVIGAASPFGLDAVCAAATGLCDLLDAAREGAFDWRLATVHAQAMRLLMELPPQAEAERDAVLQGLRAVVARKLGPA